MTSISQFFGKISATLANHGKLVKEQAPDAIIRGFKWAGILIAVTTIPLVVANLFFADLTDSTYSLGHTSQIGLALAALAGGAKIHWIASANEFNLNVSGSAKLTLLTVLLQVAALRQGRKLGRTALGTLYIPVVLTALGFASTLFLATYLTHGYDGVIAAPQASDFLRLALCVAVPMTIGAILRQYSDNGSVSGFRDSLKSIRIYAVLLTATTILGIAVFWLVEIIRPDFLYSQAATTDSTPQHFYLYLFGAILAFALNLPAIVIGTLSVLSGASIAASVFSTIEFPSFLTSSINKVCEISNLSCVATSHSISNSAGLITLVNDYSLAKRATFVAIFLFTIGLLMALSSSFAATSSASSEPLRKRVFRSLISYSLVAGYFIWLVNGEFSMTEQPTSKLQTNLNHGGGSIGLAVGTLFAIAAIFAFIAGMATGEKAKAGLPIAFPRIAKVFRVEQSAQIESQAGWRAFGFITSTVLSLTIVFSLIGATYELVYAKNHGPKFYAAEVQSTLENGDIRGFIKLTETLKKNPELTETLKSNKSELYDACIPKPYYCLRYRKVQQKVKQVVKIPTQGLWLKKEVMARALPKSSAPVALTIKNSNEQSHKTGQLDATITYLIDSGSGTVEYPLTLTGSTRSLFHVELNKNIDADYLTAAKYKYRAQPVKLSLSKGEFYPKSLMKKFTINGKLSKLGTFNTVPGTYRIKLPGYKLILPTDVVLQTDSLRESVQVGAEAKVPAKMATLMEKKYKKYQSSACKMKFTSQQIKTDCWSDMDIWRARKLISGKTLDFSDSYAITKAHSSGLKCIKQSTELTSASSVLTHYKCTSTITQTMKMSTKAQYAQGDPIYREVPVYEKGALYDACPDEPYVCYEYEQVLTGTERRLEGYKRGPLITPAKSVTGIFKSKMQKNLYIRGVMLSTGKYTVQID